MKELPRNIEALQGIGFDQIKKAANNLKRIKDIIDKSIEKNNIKRLEDARKQVDRALEHLETFTEVLNMEREITLEIKEAGKAITKKT